MLRPFVVIVFVSLATGAFADPAALTGDELKQAVAGSTVEIDTPLGTTVPMKFAGNGLVSAEAGVLAAVLGSAKDRGRWWVDGEKLCTKWFRWFDAGVRCITIKVDGTRIFWRKVDDGETGTGTLVTGPSIAPPKQTVIAKAEPAKETKPKPEANPQPTAKVEAAVKVAAAEKAKPAPESERRATRLAGPPREVPDETVSTAATAKQDTGAGAATIVSSLEEKPAPEPGREEGRMRFGGAGLLEAAGVVPSLVPSAEAKPVAKSTTESGAGKASSAMKTEVTYATAAAQPVKKPAAQGVHALSGKSEREKRPVTNRKGTETASLGAATSSSRQIALYRVRGVADYDVLNVRRGPSEQHMPVASIPPTGRSVEITGKCREAWCPIRYRNVTGWVNSYYLAEDGTRGDIPGAPPVATR